MKKLMLVIIAVCAINAPSAQAAEHPVVGKAIDGTVSVTKRVVRFPLALVTSTWNAVGNLLVNNPISEAWSNTK